MHLAVKQTNTAIVQALIVFGADLEAKNNKGFTVRHTVPSEMSSSNYDKILYYLHAVGAKRYCFALLLVLLFISCFVYFEINSFVSTRYFYLKRRTHV